MNHAVKRRLVYTLDTGRFRKYCSRKAAPVLESLGFSL